MAVIIKIADIYATINQYSWKSSNKTLEQTLNFLLPKGGPSPSDPHPDYTAAEKVVKSIGGRIVESDPPPLTEKGVVY